MSRPRTDSRLALLAMVSLASVVWLLVFMAPARAGVPPSSDSTTTTEESTTTTEAVTTTTEAVTTTSRQATTTTRSAPTSTAQSTSSITNTSTTVAPPSSVEDQAPEIVSDDTLPARTNGSDDSGLSTDTKLAFVVGGLVAVGLLIGLLTFLYWRHTRPQRYMDALDALADVEHNVPRSADDVATAEHAAIPAGVAAGAGGATSAIRILETDEPASTSDATVADDDASDEPVSLDEPTTITTIEDLKTKGAFEED